MNKRQRGSAAPKKREDLAKLFGNEKNFQLISSLMGQTAVTAPDKEVKVEKALLDLNEMKTQLIQEKQQRPPQPTLPTMSSAFKPPTLTGFKAPMVTDTKQRPMSSSFYGTQYNAQKSLTTNIEQMDASQLRERLLVAETLLKNLYSRNKELESTETHPVSKDQPGLAKELEEKQRLIESLQNQLKEARP